MDIREAEVVIYNNSLAGYTAAWVVWRFLAKQPIYVRRQHATETLPSCVSQKKVLVVDFAYPAVLSQQLADMAKDYLVVDHHISAARQTSSKIVAVTGKSTCVALWEMLFPKEEIPRFMLLIQDTDQNGYKISGSKEFCEYLETEKREFENWSMYLSHDYVKAAMQEGALLVKYINSVVEKIIVNAVRIRFHGHETLIVNASSMMDSVGTALAQNATIGMCWYFDHHRNIYKCSLRTKSDDVSVAEIAEMYEGGGTHKAAGFIYRGPFEVIVRGGITKAPEPQPAPVQPVTAAVEEQDTVKEATVEEPVSPPAEDVRPADAILSAPTEEAKPVAVVEQQETKPLVAEPAPVQPEPVAVAPPAEPKPQVTEEPQAVTPSQADAKPQNGAPKSATWAALFRPPTPPAANSSSKKEDKKPREDKNKQKKKKEKQREPKKNQVKPENEEKNQFVVTEFEPSAPEQGWNVVKKPGKKDHW